ncbi:uncharacterized protein [Antedon mediterranea]|uniref:uncharacterized protein n=1 Tax=Antedon mediterranea TaxID=105859 RepID=UPI003AF45D3F
MLLNVKHQIIFGIALSIIEQSKAECDYGMYKDQWSGDCLECADCRTNGEDVKRSYETECMELQCPRYCGHDFATDLNLLAMPKMQCTDDPVLTTLSSSTTQNGSIPTYSSILTTVAPTTDVTTVAPTSSTSNSRAIVISVFSVLIVIVAVSLSWWCCRKNCWNGNGKRNGTNSHRNKDELPHVNGTTEMLLPNSPSAEISDTSTITRDPCMCSIDDLMEKSTPDSLYQQLRSILNSSPQTVIKIAQQMQLPQHYMLTFKGRNMPFDDLVQICKTLEDEIKVSHIAKALTTQGTMNENEKQIFDELLNCNVCRPNKENNRSQLPVMQSTQGNGNFVV